MRVDESRATAALAGDLIEVRLPLAVPADQKVTAEAWILSPTGEKGAVVTEVVAPGTKAIQFSLPRPRDKKGKLVEDIEWYRVGYSIESPLAPFAHGILALGAITTNLFHFSLAGPSGNLTPGRPLAVRVFAGNPVTRSAVHGVQITAQLAIDLPGQKIPQKIAQSAAVDDFGEALFTFPIPNVTGVSASLHLSGTLRELGDETATSRHRPSPDRCTPSSAFIPISPRTLQRAWTLLSRSRTGARSKSSHRRIQAFSS